MKVLKELKNDLLKRKEVEVVVTQDINPSFDEATKEIAKQFKASEDTIKIKKVQGNFGSHDFVIEANIYDTKEAMDTIEVKTKKEKEAEAKTASSDVPSDTQEGTSTQEEGTSEDKEAAPAAEPATEEKPAEEEKKEEVKEEADTQ